MLDRLDSPLNSPALPDRPGVERKTVVIVDAYSSGRRLSRSLAARGCRLVHVSSGLQPSTDLSVSPETFDVILAADDLAVLLDRLAPMRPDAIIPGCESGVLLADELAHRLGLDARNEFERSAARRDKFHMIEALRRASLRAAEHTIADAPDPIVEWVRAKGLPVVIKPPSSTGTDAVTICRSPQDVAPAIERVLTRPSKLSRTRNRRVLAETFLDGEEYIVDTVVGRGHTFFSEFVHSKKVLTKRGYSLYDYQEVLSFDDPAFEGVASYYRGVQGALGIEVGATHGELKRTSAGPVLIEVGARVGGGGITEFAEHCYRYSSFSAIGDAYLQPERFADRYGTTNELERRGMLVSLLNPRSQVLKHRVDASHFASLASFAGLQWHHEAGALVPETTDLFTAPGEVRLIHEDRGQLHADLREVRRVERELYGGGWIP